MKGGGGGGGGDSARPKEILGLLLCPSLRGGGGGKSGIFVKEKKGGTSSRSHEISFCRRKGGEEVGKWRLDHLKGKKKRRPFANPGLPLESERGRGGELFPDGLGERGGGED